MFALFRRRSTLGLKAQSPRTWGSLTLTLISYGMVFRKVSPRGRPALLPQLTIGGSVQLWGGL